MTTPSAQFNFAGKTKAVLGEELLSLLANDNKFDEEKALALIAAGANTEVRNENDETPLNIAAFKGKTKVALALIAANADVDAPDFLNMRPIMGAASGGYEEIFDALLAKKAIITGKDELNVTIFHHAAEGGSAHIVGGLIAVAGLPPEPEMSIARRAAKDKGHMHIVKLFDDAIFARDLPLRQEAERKANALAHIGDSFRDGTGSETQAPEKAVFRKRSPGYT